MDLWKRAQIGARWMRDSFASWFTTSWLYLILWTVVGVAFAVLLYIDAMFSRSLAPDSVSPLSFQGMGIAYRLFAASFLMAAARCAFKGVPGKWTFRALGAFASVIVCLHAFGFGFEALSERREQAMALRDVSGVQEQSIADQRAFLEGRKAEIDRDLGQQVDALDAEIRQYITDGLNNDDLADDTRQRRTALQDQAAIDKRAIDEQIMQLVVDGSQARTDTIETEANAQPWHPLFVGLAQLFNGTWEPSDKQIYVAAIMFVIFWVLLAESLVIFLPERIYVMHLNDAARAEEKDPVRVAAGQKAAETRKRKNRLIKKIEEQWQGYERQWLAGLKKARNTNWSADAINDYHFNGQVDHIISIGRRAGTRSEFEDEVRIIKRMDENLPAVTKPNNVDIIDPDPESINGTGQPLDEGDIHADDDTSGNSAY